MTEFELIERFFKRPTVSALVGNGDDCAVIAPTLGQAFAVTTDILIEGRHFLATLDPYKLGQRAVAVNFSDLASMGAKPVYALLSLTLPSVDEMWLQRFSSGLWSVLEHYRVELVGGNTTRGPLSVAMTAFGEVPPGQIITRAGARIGDDVWVSGAMGDAGWAYYHLLGKMTFPTTTNQIARYETPQARVELGLALRGIANACIDISDGLLSEAKHIAQASGVDLRIEFDTIPTGLRAALQDPASQHLAKHCVLATGDVYELLFTTAPQHRDEVTRRFSQLALSGARIGQVMPRGDASKASVQVLSQDGHAMSVASAGWDHFETVESVEPRAAS